MTHVGSHLSQKGVLMKHKMVALFTMVALALSVSLAAAQTQVVNVYSARTYGAMEAAFIRFTEETGIEVRVSQGSVQSLLQRLEAEGTQTPADAFFSIDAGTLQLAADKGLLQAVESEVLMSAVPMDLRSPDNLWFAVSQRFRTIMYNPATVQPEQLSTYAALADPMWKGRLCLRPATHIYTISLVGAMIAELGAEEAERVVAGWVANEPQYIDSDTRILETIEAGGCDVGITNHYYLGRKLGENPDFGVSLFWANQGEDQTGVVRNISGMGITTSALNRDNAVRLLEWMVTEGQAADENGIPGGNYEYPIAYPTAAPMSDATAEPMMTDVPLHPIIAEFGPFKFNPLALTDYGALQAQALEILERTGYGF
jgi:iron(III) transport system substrate-binding protein